MPSLRTINQLLMRAAMPALVLLLSSIIAVLYLDARAQQARQQEARHLGLVLDATRAEFLKGLNSVMYLATGVAAYIQANNGYVATEQTSSWLRSLPSYNPYIRNIGLAPDNRISFVYPLEGNQQVIGVSYRDLPEQWPRVALAMQRREPVMDGPVTLLQGGLGLVYRVPVFLHGGRFWGMVSTVMSLDHVMAGLQEQAGRQGVTLRFLPEQGVLPRFHGRFKQAS